MLTYLALGAEEWAVATDGGAGRGRGFTVGQMCGVGCTLLSAYQSEH